MAWTIAGRVLEVEAKLELLSPGSLRDRLKASGATRTSTEHHEDIFFDHPSRDLPGNDEAFRLRITDEGMWLTHKGPKHGDAVKVRAEEEVRVMDDPRPMLEALGFRPAAVLRKDRESWGLADGLHVTIDTIDGLGTFAEVEALAEDETKATELVETTIKGLGLDGAMRLSMSYLEMALDAGVAAVERPDQPE